MCYAFWRDGRADDAACFDVFFRKPPFGGEFTIFAGLEDALMWGVPMKRKDMEQFTAAAVRTEMLRLTNIIFKWLSTKTEHRNDDVVHNALTRLWASYATPMWEVGPPVSMHVTQQVTRLRLAVTRIGIISSSTYLPAGYAVVEAFCFLALSLVICGRYSNQASGYGVIIGTSILYASMLHLLRDIDNPFEYTAIAEDVAQFSDRRHRALWRERPAVLPRRTSGGTDRAPGAGMATLARLGGAGTRRAAAGNRRNRACETASGQYRGAAAGGGEAGRLCPRRAGGCRAVDGQPRARPGTGGGPAGWCDGACGRDAG